MSEFQLMICSSITSYTVTESYWAKGSIGWLDLGGVMTPLITPILVFVNVFVCLFACVFVRMFVCCVFNVVILNVFVFPIYSMLKWQNEIIIHFVEEHPSSLNLMTFCQVLHGDYWPPCSFFYKGHCIHCFQHSRLIFLRKTSLINRVHGKCFKLKNNGWLE